MIPVIELKNITVSYDQRVVLNDISLQIKAGHFVAIIGPNGAGKTTLLRVITGQIKPQTGEVRLWGEQNPANRSFIGYVPQKSKAEANFPVSVYDVVMMGRYGKLGLFKSPGVADRQIAVQCLERVNMQEFAGRQFGALSGGQQQRVLIARALCGEPRLLLFDEPTAGVDRANRDSFFQLVRQLNRDLKLTILFVTHEIEVVPRLVDEIICLNQRIFIHDKPAKVITDDVFREMYGMEFELLVHGHTPHRMISEHTPGTDEPA